MGKTNRVVNNRSRRASFCYLISQVSSYIVGITVERKRPSFFVSVFGLEKWLKSDEKLEGCRERSGSLYSHSCLADIIFPLVLPLAFLSPVDLFSSSHVKDINDLEMLFFARFTRVILSVRVINWIRGSNNLSIYVL